MGFNKDARCKLWSITDDNGKFANCNISSNTKVGENWEKDFSSKFVRFVGSAYKKLKEVSIPQNGINIKLGNCTAQNCYIKDGQTTYLKSGRFIVFDFEFIDEVQKSDSNGKLDDDFMSVPDTDSSELPFD